MMGTDMSSPLSPSPATTRYPLTRIMSASLFCDPDMPTPKKKKKTASEPTRIGPRKAKLFLREWRKFKDWSQEELAARLGTTKQTISKQENGQRGITADHLAELAEQFGCKPQDFFSPPERWLAESALDRLTPEQRQKVIDLATTLRPTGTNG